ncbi:MAG TPA: hypothetical protein VKA27_05000 [Sunxiuqinia sp.]|nr:hypothetical protein [Sunxiuqinia sp.]
MKTSFTFTVTLILIVFLFQSCSGPQAIVKLQPQQKDVKWLFGQSIATDSLYGIIYEVGFDRTVDNRYWFDFNIINRSNMPILIDPTKFAYEAYDSLHNIQTLVSVKAIDPEKEILDIDKSLSQHRARAKNHLGISLVAAGVDIATGIATLSDDNPRNDHLRTHLFEETQDDAIENAMETQDLNKLRNDWAQSTIRKTTLNCNYSMHGKVFFPAMPNAAIIKLLLPVDDKMIEMKFNQTKHSPY